MTSVIHSHTEFAFGIALFVSIVEGRICFAFEPQELLGELTC